MAYKIDSSRCVGCGACAYECLFDIPRPVDEEKSKYHIDRDKCIGCGLCAKGCPVDCIKRTDYIPEGHKLASFRIDTEKCVKCGSCIAACRLKAPCSGLRARERALYSNMSVTIIVV